MPLSVRVQPVDRDIQVVMREALSPQRRSAILAQTAREIITESQVKNAQVLGYVPKYRHAVDGRSQAPFESVKPDGLIVAEFQLIGPVLQWIVDQLETHSPVRKGIYKGSHRLFVDGVQMEPSPNIVTFDTAEIVNTQPYARKIEKGLSPQAPDGVYQVVAVLAQRKFGPLVNVRYSFRTITSNRGTERNPAIIVRPRG